MLIALRLRIFFPACVLHLLVLCDELASAGEDPHLTNLSEQTATDDCTWHSHAIAYGLVLNTCSLAYRAMVTLKLSTF